MTGIRKMIFANLKKKKIQNILIGIIIMASALIFSTSLSLLSSINKPYERMFNDAKGSHINMYFDSNIHNGKDAAEWFRSQEGVESVSLASQYPLREKVLVNSKKIQSMVVFVEMSESNLTQDKLTVLEGEKKDFPGPGEVWVPVVLADNSGIKAGDTMEVPAETGKVELKVSALVVDPHYASTMMDPTRLWVAQGQLSSMFPREKLSSVIMGVRLSDYSRKTQLLKDFEKHLGMPLSGMVLDYDMIRSANLFVYQIIGTVLMSLSLIIMLITVFIMSYTIANTILTDYKTIGILKSQGFSSRNVVSIYSGQYLVLSLAAIPVGVILSTFASGALLSGLMRAMGMPQNGADPIQAVISAAVILAVIMLTAFINSRKAGKVKPAEAVRYGMPVKQASAKASVNISSLKRLPLPLILGIKDAFSGRRQSLFLCFTAGVTALVIAFSINMYNTLNRMTYDTRFWGFESTDLSITPSISGPYTPESLVERLREFSEVKMVSTSSYVDNCSIYNDKTDSSKTIVGFVYSGSLDELGMENIEGRNPVRDNEASIAVNTSKELGKKVGDTVEIYINGVKTNLLVTGIYQSISNFGNGFRVPMSVIKKINPEFKPMFYYVVTKEGTDVDAFAGKLKSKLGSYGEVQTTKNLMTYRLKSVISQFALVVMLIMIIFTLVSFITVFNSTTISIHHQKRNYGVFKGLGMTQGQIRLSIACRILFTALTGIIVGIPAGLFAAPKLVNIMFKSLGIIKFPFFIDLVPTFLIIPFCLLIAGASAWMPSGKVKKLNPRNLIVE